MTITLKSFLQNALTPVDRYTSPDEVQTLNHSGYKWVYVKEQKSIKYLETSEALVPFEKILHVMCKQLKNLQPQDHSEKQQLISLKSMVVHYTAAYKAENEGFFGMVYLFWQGLFYGGHVDDLSDEVINCISVLESVETGTTPMRVKNARNQAKHSEMEDLKKDLSAFLKTAAPSSPSVDKNRWAYCKHKKTIKYCNLSLESETPGVDLFSSCHLSKVFRVMKRNLRLFKNLDEVNPTQKLQLANMRQIVQLHADEFKEQNSGLFGVLRFRKVDKLYEKIISDIDFLLNQVNSTPPPDYETKEKMRFRAGCIRMEILTTEETFIEVQNKSIEAIKHLIHLSQGPLECSKKVAPFFSGTTGINLNTCLEAFIELKNAGEAICEALTAIYNENYSDEEKNLAVANLYRDLIFHNYSECMLKAAKYYQGQLLQLMSDLEQKNQLSRNHPIRLRFQKDHDALITVIQRLPRHVLFMADFLKNIPSDLPPLYSAVFQALESAEHHGRVLNNQISIPLVGM